MFVVTIYLFLVNLPVIPRAFPSPAPPSNFHTCVYFNIIADRKSLKGSRGESGPTGFLICCKWSLASRLDQVVRAGHRDPYLSSCRFARARVLKPWVHWLCSKGSFPPLPELTRLLFAYQLCVLGMKFPVGSSVGPGIGAVVHLHPQTSCSCSSLTVLWERLSRFSFPLKSHSQTPGR